MAAFMGCFVSPPSDLVERYSEEAIDKAAAIPVMLPVRAISLESLKARVNPANAPVNSTKASFRPSTTEPIYSSRSSLIRPINFCS